MVTASIMPASSDTGIKAPDRPPTWLDAMTPPFFTASLSMARAAVVPWAPQLFQTHLLEDMGHRVAHRRGGSQGQVHNAEGHAQTGGWLPVPTS